MFLHCLPVWMSPDKVLHCPPGLLVLLATAVNEPARRPACQPAKNGAYHQPAKGHEGSAQDGPARTHQGADCEVGAGGKGGTT